MRRHEYAQQDPAEIERLFEEAEHGYLGVITTDGWPSVVPLNFVKIDKRIYLHGSARGEKMKAMAKNDRVTFTVVQDFSLIPSYFRDPKLACPATQYYRSAMVRGRARAVDCLEEKATALQALMDKLQPEGGFEPIKANAPLYRKSLETTSVTAVDIETLSAKFKFGQNPPSKKRRTIAEQLDQRGEPKDEETARVIRGTCPHKRDEP